MGGLAEVGAMDGPGAGEVGGGFAGIGIGTGLGGRLKSGWVLGSILGEPMVLLAALARVEEAMKASALV